MPIDPKLVKWDDASPQIDAAKVQWDSQPEQPAAPGGLADLVRGRPAPLSRMDKFKQGLRDPIDGGAQLLTHLLPDSVVQAGNKANNWLADKTGLVARLPEGGVGQQVSEANAKYESRRKANGEDGIDGWRLAGGAASPVNLALGGGPAGATLGARIGLGAARGAASASLSPATTGDDFWAEKARQVAIGAGTGGALSAAAAGIGRLISPNASKNANLELLKSEGVQPTIGQTLGGMANKVEEKLQSVPLVGDAIRSARGRANSQFQTAAYNRALEPIHDTLPAGVSGRDAVAYTENALKSSYDQVLTRIGAIPADQPFAAKLSSLGQLVNRSVLSPDARQKFEMVLSDVRSAFDSNGMLTSDGYKTLESALGSDFRKLTSSQDIYDGRLAPAVKQLQQELRDLLKRQAGQNADDLQAVNAGWANFKRVQNAASKVGAEDGQFTPAQFQNAVRTMDKSKDKGAFARGGALGQDLGDAGKSVLTSTVPNSGTTDRLLNAGMVGSWFVNPAIPMSALGGAGLYLPSVQRALVAAASSRPAAAQGAAQAFRKASPMFIPGLTQLSLDELK